MKRVLLVERDSLHRDLMREWLEEGGVQVLSAAATAPLAGDIDAVLVDVSCQQQAHTTLEAWRRAYPDAALVLVSARFCAGDMANDAMAARLGVTGILAKPFTRADLWTALRLPVAPAHR
ncbi:MAG TPA: response regulator [Steroidobacteraceae bacterium]|nr:response regulator [Steroidobacteraceae bacterium]